jgi:outer membrane lipoprotein-sorting protein
MYNNLRPMGTLLRGVLLAGVTATACWAQPASELLARLDRFAQSFRGMKAEIRTTNHIAGIDEDDQESGTIVLKRDGPGKVRMLISVTGANASIWVLRDQMAEIYHPKIDEIQEYDIRQYKDIAHQLFQLGFGVAGADLARSYTVSSLRREAVEHENATLVELVPKSPEVLKRLSKVALWISDKSDCAVRQKFYFPDGGYRLAEFSGITVNPTIPTSAFDLPKSARKVRVN